MISQSRLVAVATLITASPAAILFAGPYVRFPKTWVRNTERIDVKMQKHLPRARFPKTWIRNMDRVDMNMQKIGYAAKTILMRGRA